jgi:hypothetical protein
MASVPWMRKGDCRRGGVMPPLRRWRQTLIDNVVCSPSDVKNDLIIDDSDLERRHGEKRW